jgi:hypothetical protein
MATTSNPPLTTSAHGKSLFAFWLLWVAASSAAFGLGAAAFWVLGQTYREDSSNTLRTIAFVVTVGIVIASPGVLHRLILRQRFLHAAWWIPASGIGSVFGFAMLLLGIAVADTRGGPTGFWPITYGLVVPIAAVALGGAAAGTMQWLVLRRWVAHAGWWVLVSSVSWVVATWAYMTLTRANDVHLFLGAVVSGACSGGITGLALVCLLRNTKSGGSAAADAQARPAG